jgi:Necrosis inducing protein (NPP1)
VLPFFKPRIVQVPDIKNAGLLIWVINGFLLVVHTTTYFSSWLFCQDFCNCPLASWQPSLQLQLSVVERLALIKLLGLPRQFLVAQPVASTWRTSHISTSITVVFRSLELTQRETPSIPPQLNISCRLTLNSAGLNPTGATNGDCSSNTGQIYVRGKTYGSYYALMYSCKPEKQAFGVANTDLSRVYAQG